MMCADVCGAGRATEPRGRWSLECGGEGRAARASEEEMVPYGDRLGTGDFDSGAEEGSLLPNGAGAGGGGARSV